MNKLHDRYQNCPFDGANPEDFVHRNVESCSSKLDPSIKAQWASNGPENCTNYIAPLNPSQTQRKCGGKSRPKRTHPNRIASNQRWFGCRKANVPDTRKERVYDRAYKSSEENECKLSFPVWFQQPKMHDYRTNSTQWSYKRKTFACGNNSNEPS